MLLFRLPFILLEVLLREGAGVLARLVGLVRGGDDDGGVTVTPVAPDVRSRPGRAPAPAAAPAPRPGPPPPTADEAIARRRAREAAAPPPPPPATPSPVPPGNGSAAHVDREATVVESLGPEEDVHAIFQVDVPWAGYDDDPASEIVRRLREADEATKAVVRLYEQQHKSRRTVLRATD